MPRPDFSSYDLSDADKRDLELATVSHTYAKAGRYVIAVKAIDIFGTDTMTLVPVTVG